MARRETGVAVQYRFTNEPFLNHTSFTSHMCSQSCATTSAVRQSDCKERLQELADPEVVSANVVSDSRQSRSPTRMEQAERRGIARHLFRLRTSH